MLPGQVRVLSAVLAADDQGGRTDQAAVLPGNAQRGEKMPPRTAGGDCKVGMVLFFWIADFMTLVFMAGNLFRFLHALRPGSAG